MSLSIDDLKAKQAELMNKIKKSAEDKSFGDSRFWKTPFDEEKGGTATIRFLPSADGATEMPYQKVIRHYFQGPNGKKYTEASLRTLGKPDPLADLNWRLYQTEVESNQKQASAQKQRHRFFANILVIKDPANPENEGKVFLYEYGPAVDNLVQELLFPDETLDPDAESVNPFDVFDAPNLVIKVKPQSLGKAIVPNYDKTAFAPKHTAVPNIEEHLKNLHSLKEFIAPDKFKSYEKLSQILVSVLGEETGTGMPTIDAERYAQVTKSSDDENEVTTSPTTSVKDDIVKSTPGATDGEDEDDEVARLRKLMGE